jgi:hypothetical protein
MSLAENKSVTFGPTGFCRINAHYLSVKHGHQVRHRQRRSNMRTVTEVGHANNVTPDPQRQLFAGLPTF